MERLAVAYETLLRRAFRFPVIIFGASLAAFVVSLVVLSTMGREFMPELDEGAITLQTMRLPSIALRHADDSYQLIRRFGYESYRDRLG